MAKTLDMLVDECRLMLKDRRAPFRYKQDDLLQAINSAFLEMRRMRPDAFVVFENDAFLTIDPPHFTEDDLALTPATAIPTPDFLYVPLVYQTVGKLQLGDDEFAIDNRAMTLLATVQQQLLGKNA